MQRAGLISVEYMHVLQAMVGFRNILVHEYKKLDIHIMVDVIEHRMRELLHFANSALKIAG